MSVEKKKLTFSLHQLLNWFDLDCSFPDFQITGIAIDSRQVKQGNLFCAIPGYTADGRLFIANAVDRGASIVLVDNSSDCPVLDGVPVPVFFVKNLRQRIGYFLLYISEASTVPDIFGVTGTNGKTSCCFYLAQYLALASKCCALSGTIGSGIYPDLKPSERTTVDVLAVHEFLQNAIDQGASHIAMEVSSHGLHQHRVNGVPFKTAIFTNLTQDHLDYHGSMHEYAQAKAELFQWETLRYAVINYDDSYSGLIREAVTSQAECLTYSLSDHQADVFVTKMVASSDGIIATLNSPWGEGELHSSLLGQFNLSNLVAVISALAINGFSFNWLLNQSSKIQAVAGRMQCINNEPNDTNKASHSPALKSIDLPRVIVDYAHTPDALASVLLALRGHTKGRLLCVFGCGGDRDSTKRPLMGKVAESIADYIILTDDNPRTENSEKIIADIVSGFSEQFKRQDDQCEIIYNRSQAIKRAVAMSQADDCVLIAGKGHETYQIFKDKTVYFCDADEVKLVFEEPI